MKKVLFNLIFLNIFHFLLFLPLSWASGSLGYKKVFIIHSYSEDNITAAPQQKGILEALNRCGINIEIKTFYMKTKTRFITPHAIKKRGELAIERLKEFDPDVVIVVDDNACREVMLRLVDSNYKFVFLGMNTPPEVYNQKVRFMESRRRPGHNITGVYEKIYVVSLINFIARVFPSLKKAFVFISTSPTGKGIERTIFYEMKKVKPAVSLELISVSNTQEYERKLKEINQTYSKETAMILPVIDRLKSSSGVLTFKEVVPFTVKRNRLIEVTPGVPLVLIKLGLLAGGGPDYKKMGIQAGEKACKILKGISPAEIPIEDAREFNVGINLKRAKELGIRIPFELFLCSNAVLGGSSVE